MSLTPTTSVPEASPFSPVDPVKPAAPYVGGKSRLAKLLIAQIESQAHQTYAEPFVGMGGVFLRRKLRPRAEAINDLSGCVANFFRVVQRHHTALLDLMRFQITSRAAFERHKATDPGVLTDLERAVRFLYLQRTTYGGLREGVFGVRPKLRGKADPIWLAGLIEALHARLTAVTLEQLPFDDFMRRYDAPGTLFFVDPPYWGIEGLYGADLFSRADYAVLRERLRNLRGKFILTLNDKPEVRDYFAGFEQQPVEFHYSLAKGHSVGRELIIRNFSVSPG